MSELSLMLLGGLKVRKGESLSVAISAKKTKALLAYLALHPGDPQPREKLAALLWEDSGEAQARHSLRQTLTTLRKSLGLSDPRMLTSGEDAVGLAPGAIAVDVFEFERLADVGSLEALEAALILYRGEFLEGFNPPRTGVRGLADGRAQPVAGAGPGGDGCSAGPVRDRGID